MEKPSVYNTRSYYVKNFDEQYLKGLQSEKEILPIIQKYFDDDITPTTATYDRHDYKGTNYYYELKTRTNEYSKYPTTMISLLKTKKENVIFLFRFTDGLYYIKYNKEQFNQYEVKKYSKYGKPIDYVYIPIIDLIKINILE
jgi:hypothetical protein